MLCVLLSSAACLCLSPFACKPLLFLNASYYTLILLYPCFFLLDFAIYVIYGSLRITKHSFKVLLYPRLKRRIYVFEYTPAISSGNSASADLLSAPCKMTLVAKLLIKHR